MRTTEYTDRGFSLMTWDVAPGYLVQLTVRFGRGSTLDVWGPDGPIFFRKTYEYHELPRAEREAEELAKWVVQIAQRKDAA